MSEQLELDLEGGMDNHIYFESLTLSADTVLASNLGKFNDVFVIGVCPDGFLYSASNENGYFWTYALDRAKAFLMRHMDN